MITCNFKKSEILELTNISDFEFNECVLFDRNNTEYNILLYQMGDVVEKVYNFFNKTFDELISKNKTQVWFKTENPQLANFTPKQMILLGKIKRVIQFVDYALEQNTKDF